MHWSDVNKPLPSVPIDTTSSGHQREGDEVACLLLDGQCRLRLLICDCPCNSRVPNGFELSAYLALCVYYVGFQFINCMQIYVCVVFYVCCVFFLQFSGEFCNA